MLANKIASSTQAVIHLHKHLQDLKNDSLKLKKSISAAKRGYFTPKEESEVKHLFVAYWNARSALFEIIHELQGLMDEISDSKIKDRLFLVAFASGTLLVDAAQFLFETFDELGLVREKLNEEDALLGIPKYSYSKILDSLYSPENLIELYYGRKYFEENIDSFKSRSKRNKGIRSLLSIIEKLHSSVHISTTEYLKNIAKANWRKLVEEIEDLTVHRALYSVQEVVSRTIGLLTTHPLHSPSLPRKIRRQIKDLIQPGDIFLTRKEYQLTNYFLPGYWPHSAVYLGVKKGRHIVLEALKDGVKVRPISSILSVDSMIVMRPKLSESEIKTALERGMEHVGKPYDFDFDFKCSERLVCTEVVYRAFDGVGPINFKLNSLAGRRNLSSVDILKYAFKKHTLEPIALFCPDKESNMFNGKDCIPIIKSFL